MAKDFSSSQHGLHHVEEVMGMPVSIDIRDAGVDAAAVVALVDWLHHVDATFSTYKVDSPISALGRGELDQSQVTNEIAGVLEICRTLKDRSRGLFDVFNVPAVNGTSFDPSGVVKGWALQKGAELLESFGCCNFLINGGGDVVLRGKPESERQWQVGIRHPELSDALALAIQTGSPQAVATSANYERGHHIVDPHTGVAASSLASATIVGPSLTWADGYATTLFIMGLDGLGWVEDLAGYEAYVITHNATTHWSPGFKKYLG